MGRSVRISEASVRAFWPHALALQQTGQAYPGTPLGRAVDEFALVIGRLGRVPKSKPPRKPRHGRHYEAAFGSGSMFASRKPSKEEKRDRRASIREKVFARATDGTPDEAPRCEGPLGSNPMYQGRCISPATDLQHVFGRGKGRMPESERNCLAACRTCHEAEGRNIPSSAAWWAWFAQWFQGRGFTEEAARARRRARFDEVRATSPAAPRAR